VEYKLDTSDDDVSFAIYCFFKDLTNIRLFVRRTWREFKRGEIGLQAAAFTMNATIGMIEKLSVEFKEAYPRFNKSETNPPSKETNTDTNPTKINAMHFNILHFIYKGYCNPTKGSIFIDMQDGDKDPFAYTEDGQKLRSSTVMCAHTTELACKYFIEDERDELRLSPDEKRFIKCMSQLAAFQPFMGDMVQKAICAMVHEGQVETWNIFALQIFWDTQRELGDMLSVPKQVLESTGHEYRKRYHDYLNTEGLDKVGGFHKDCRGGIQEHLDEVERLTLDAKFQAWVDQCEKEHCVAWWLNVPNFSIFGCHPALCGLVSMKIRDDYHRMSISMASAHCRYWSHRISTMPLDSRVFFKKISTGMTWSSSSRSKAINGLSGVSNPKTAMHFSTVWILPWACTLAHLRKNTGNQ
jgi:hypothetical protein